MGKFETIQKRTQRLLLLEGGGSSKNIRMSGEKLHLLDWLQGKRQPGTHRLQVPIAQ